jgi:CrcB protein
MNLLLVIVGAAVGAPMRYLVDRSIQARHRTQLPWGTFAVNIAASVVLGLVTGAVASGFASHQAQLLIGTGLCATLSTYSTFSYETMRLAETGAARLAVLNVVLSVLAGIGAAFLGVRLGQLL